MWQRCMDRLCEKWVLLLLMVVGSALFLACGDDEYTANVSRLEISTFLLPNRLTAGTREFLGVIAYNDAGVLLDALSGFEVYRDIRWKSSNKAIASVETFDDDKSAALVTFKKPGQVTITANFRNLSDSVTLTVR